MLWLAAAIELAIDMEDLRVLLPFAAIVILSTIGLAALVLTPWRRIPPPAGLDDWGRK